MIHLLAMAALRQGASAFDFDVQSGRGLTISASGVPIVKGSSFQYYQAGWLKAYYGSTNSEQKIDRTDADDVKVTFTGYGGVAHGQVDYHRRGNDLQAHYDLHWDGSDPAEIELTAGLIDSQALQAGTLSADGSLTRDLRTHAYSGGGDFESRRYAKDSSDYLFDAPLARLEAKTSTPTTLFDARGYDQDYAQGRALWWFGSLKLDISKEKPVQFDVQWDIRPKPVPADRSNEVKLTLAPTASAVDPNDYHPVLIPKPTVSSLNYDKLLAFTQRYTWPAGLVKFWKEEFLSDLARRFQLPVPNPKDPAIAVDGGMSKLGYHPGGYQITITDHSISVLGQEEEGLRDGLRRLAQMVFVQGGKLVLPTGYLYGAPEVAWRGVHLFVGPDATEFQHKLWQNVLLPLGFDKVVLQCERTKWDCMPNMQQDPNNMAKTDLAKLFDWYRSFGVEPIPLIQSFGHMEWFFENGGNLDLAMNPKAAYGIDPRNPKAKDALGALWDEACDLLKPDMLHFGCDEVDMTGFPVDQSALMTDLWTTQMGVLKGIADKHGAKMMIWGDQALAPGEAVDATNADTKETAAKRRAAIPKGTWIADWHYKNGPKPEAFTPSLDLWKGSGFVPVASTWYQPDNIRCFDAAAAALHDGTLQTTWSGYISNEGDIERDFDQFSAMVLAAEYSWTGRVDPVSKLGYDPAEVFRRLYFGTPWPTSVKSGTQAFQGQGIKDIVDRDLKLKTGDPIGLRSLVSAVNEPTSVEMGLSVKGSQLVITMDALDVCDNGTEVADLSFELANGKSIDVPLKYGQEVRAAGDSAACSRADDVDGMSVYAIPLGSDVEIKSLRLVAKSNVGGLRLYGVMVW